MPCPFRMSCEAEVDWTIYEERCGALSEEFKECSYFKELTKVPKKPSEWLSLSTPRITMPRP